MDRARNVTFYVTTAVVAWCAYSSLSHSVDRYAKYTVDRISIWYGSAITQKSTDFVTIHTAEYWVPSGVYDECPDDS